MLLYYFILLSLVFSSIVIYTCIQSNKNKRNNSRDKLAKHFSPYHQMSKL